MSDDDIPVYTVARRPAMEAWPAGTRERALRHALRYRVRARWAGLWKAAAKRGRRIATLERTARFERAERDDASLTRLADRIFELNTRVAALEAERAAVAAALGAYDDGDLASLATTLRARVAALEAAIAEHQRLMAAGVVGEAAAVLRRVSDG